MTNEFGVEVPEHSILGRLGRGGMAAVYLAREERLGRLVAVKVIDERFDRDEQFRRRFEREARTAAGLTHPNIVPVYQYGYTQDARPFISMAYLQGGSLRDRIRRRGALGVDEALAITRQIASALAAAHAQQIVHRDLKPDNVLFQGETAMLSDFGIAKVLDAGTELTGTGTNPGTVRYFSPEQANEKPVDQRSDIYALGVILYEMLTARIPIDGDSVVQIMMRIAHQPPQPLPNELRGLQPLLDAMLAKEPDARLGTAAEVVAVVQAMERNWTRFGELERLTDGVVFTPSGNNSAKPASAPEDADITRFVSSAAERTTVARANETNSASFIGEPTDRTRAQVAAVSAPARRRWLPWAAAALVGAIVGAAVIGKHAVQPAPVPTAATPAVSTPAVVALPPAASATKPIAARAVTKVAVSTPQPRLAEQPHAHVEPAPRTEPVRVMAAVKTEAAPAPAVVVPAVATAPAPAVASTTGRLVVNAIPDDAKVFLLAEGGEKTREPYVAGTEIPTGRARVVIRRVGYFPVQRVVDVQPGDNRIDVRLYPLADGAAATAADAKHPFKALIRAGRERAEASASPVQLSVVNHMPFAVWLFETDLAGQTQNHGMLAPAGHLDVASASGHAFRAMYKRQALATYRADAQPNQQFVIGAAQ